MGRVSTCACGALSRAFGGLLTVFLAYRDITLWVFWLKVTNCAWNALFVLNFMISCIERAILLSKYLVPFLHFAIVVHIFV